MPLNGKSATVVASLAMLLTIRPSAADIGGRLSDWRNTGPATRDIVRLLIMESARAIEPRAGGACGPSPSQCATFAAAQTSSGPATPQPNIPPPLAVPVEGYGDRDKLCLAWNDGCVTCQRDAAGDAACSNIGIACQPKEIKCTQRQTDPAK
jgi:hypothetical protein